jgi:hypothetical protein
MKLEEQIVSLELAKKLKELNVKQESYFHWYRYDGSSNANEFKIGRAVTPASNLEITSAFTVAELGEMLPHDCRTRRSVDEKGKWLVDTLRSDRFFRAATEADARAKMLIYLLEKKLIEV